MKDIFSILDRAAKNSDVQTVVVLAIGILCVAWMALVVVIR